MPERLANDFQTTVGAGGITNVATSLPVSAAAHLDLRNPAGQGADFTIRVEDADGSGKPAGTNVELMRVTGSGAAGASPWTVARAQEGTAAVAHAAGSIVTQVITSGTLHTFARDRSPRFRRKTGRWYGADFHGALGTVAPTSGRQYAIPYIVTEKQTYDRIAVEATVVGASNWRFAIWSDTGVIYPGAKILETVSFVPVVGANEQVIAWVPEPGLYWIGGIELGGTTMTLRSIGTVTGPMPLGAATSNETNTHSCYSAAGQTAITDPYPAAIASTTNGPNIRLRAA